MSNKKVLTKLNRRLLEENLKKVILEALEEGGETPTETTTRSQGDRWDAAREVFKNRYNSITSKEYDLLDKYLNNTRLRDRADVIKRVDSILNRFDDL